MWTSSLCRACTNLCPVDVETENGKLITVRATAGDPIYRGFSCARGLNQPDFYNHPNRLLHSLKRRRDGAYVPIPVEQATEEIAERLGDIQSAYGSRAIAFYWGMMSVSNILTIPLADAFMRALGSPMIFSASTIDKPGRPIAVAKHGSWQAPRHGYDQPEVGLLIGANPMVSFQGVPMGNPPRWYLDQLAGGMKLIVIDPRRSETARRATLHLQPAPGHDAAILAAILRVILQERLHDAAFAAEHVDGVAGLAAAVAPFDPGSVATAADLQADDIILAARMFAEPERGFVAAGTGPSMSGAGTLVEYLALCLDTLCGHCMRAGDIVDNPGVLFPTCSAVAQASPPRPAYGFGERMQSRDISQSAAGMPTGALADEIATQGPGKVHALISCAGNPANAWPDERRARSALGALDLLVQIDPWMSQTARVADYVIAPKMAFETPASTIAREMAGLYGRPTLSWDHPVGAYYPAAISPPPESDLVEEWRFLLGVAHRMGLDLTMIGPAGPDFSVSLPRDAPEPSPDEMLALLSRGSRIPFERVKSSGGQRFSEPPVVVQGKRPGWAGRLCVNDPDMIADLDATAASLQPADVPTTSFKFICRRTPQVYNSSFHPSLIGKGKPNNPAFFHPADLENLNLAKGDRVRLRSRHGAVDVLVDADPMLRRGVISMSHGFGNEEEDTARRGANVNALLDAEYDHERYSGQPRMSNIVVSIETADLSPL